MGLNRIGRYFISHNGGLLMHRLFAASMGAVCTFALTQIAYAADLPVKAPAAPIVVPHSWTGFYVGANIGGGWGNRDVSFSAIDPLLRDFFAFQDGAPAPISFRTSGVIGGLQLGYNWQFSRNWLAGFETDFNGSGMDGSGSNLHIANGGPGGPIPFTQTVTESIKWFGTVRARLGYLPTDNLLAYVTGGFAYGRVERTGTYTSSNSYGIDNGLFSFLCTAGTACFAGSSSKVATGWTLGGGIEYAFWQHWTLKAEYLYVSLEGQSLTETALAFTPGETPSSFIAHFNRANFNVARVGVNYRF
jgi:outer membrane immunogenic protein